MCITHVDSNISDSTSHKNMCIIRLEGVPAAVLTQNCNLAAFPQPTIILSIKSKPYFMCCHADEDLWHAYNLIREGDAVTATTFRKIQKDTGAGSESERVKLKICVQVEAVDFDPDGKRTGICATAIVN